MARNRQRARDRKKQRQAQNPGPRPSEPQRENVPGELEHASGSVDQFEAAIVEGAGGEPIDGDDELTADEEAALEQAATAAGSGGAEVARAPGGATTEGGPRFINFLRACWAELQRVQWPDRRQVGQATAVVIGFVIIAGAYLGVADAVAQEIVDLIL